MNIPKFNLICSIKEDKEGAVLIELFLLYFHIFSHHPKDKYQSHQEFWEDCKSGEMILIR